MHLLCIRNVYVIIQSRHLGGWIGHMFIRRIKRANGQVSIVLVEGYRENGKVKQRTVEYLGTESELTKDDPDAVNKLINKYKKAQNSKDAFIKLTINLAEKISDRNTVRNYGYFYLDKMFSELGIDKLCNEIQAGSKIEYSLKDCLRLMCFMRALKPSSKKSCQERGFDYFFEDFNLKLEQIYKSLTVFDENKDNFIKQIHHSLCEKYDRKTDLLYYDVTNYFFEIDNEDEFRKKGCSKEHRPLPIVQMGMFIDNQGLPVDYYLYEGNKNDCTTLKPSFDEVKSTYKADKVIITADKGLNNGPNLGYILSNGNGYIVSQKIRGAGKALQAEVLNEEGWHTNLSGDFRFKEFTRNIDVEAPDGKKINHDQKVVCIWSRKYQIKEKSARDALLEKIVTLASDPAKFKQSCHKGMKKYIDEITVDMATGEENKTVKVTTALNQEKIAKDEALDGYYLIVTSETHLSLSEIIEKYRGLWRIEQSFRITKSDIHGRPVFVRTKEHINAHFLTCFITLTMLRMLEIRLNRKYSAKAIIDGLNSAVAVDIGKEIYQINRRDDVVDELDQIYGLDFSNRYVRKENMTIHHSEIINSLYTTL